jgi:molybdenum cofactor sulfurtransferase
VTAWPLGPNGLLFDREWALCGADGRVLSQKRAPRLTQLRPHVDLQQRVLRLSAPRLPQQLVVLLDAGDAEHCCSSSSSSSGGAAAAAAASSCASAGRCRHQQQLAEAQQEQVISVCGQRVSTQAVPAAVVVASAAASHDDSSGSSSSSSSGTVATAGSAEQWLLQAVGVPCRLVRQIHSSRTVKQCHQQQQPSQQQQDCQAGPTHGTAQSLGFANEGQFLLVNQRSVEYVATRLLHTAAALRQTDRAAADGDSSSSSGGGSSGGKQQAVAAAGVLDALRFRPNLVVSGFEPWAEDSWSAVVVGGPLQQQQQQQQKEAQQLRPRGAVLSVIGACGRCDMVAIDQRTGQRQGSQLLSLLAQERRAGGKLQFGVLLALGAPCGAPAAREQWLRIGDCVQPVAAADTGAYM